MAKVPWLTLGFDVMANVEEFALKNHLGLFRVLLRVEGVPLMCQNEIKAHVGDIAVMFLRRPDSAFLSLRHRKIHIDLVATYWSLRIEITKSVAGRRAISTDLNGDFKWIIHTLMMCGRREMANQFYCISNLHDVEDDRVFDEYFDYFSHSIQL
jgi:hypothetical protein